MKSLIIATSLLALLCPGVAPAATHYIKADGTGDELTIQDAIDACVDGDSVLLAAGTYLGLGNVAMDFSGKAIVVTSEDGPYSTIIDCGTTSWAFRFRTSEGSGSVVSGLTIRNVRTGTNGGAFECTNSSPQILSNVIENNYTNSFGGGIYVDNGSPTIMYNTFVGNGSRIGGGGIYVTGAASVPTVAFNIIAFSTDGAGIECDGLSSPVLSCNVIFGNLGGDAVCGIDNGNNLSLDPQFCGAVGSGNYYVQNDSPCAPANSACGILIGALPVNCASVAIEQNTWGTLKSLYR